MNALPLADVKVLDFTQNLPGPYATMLLGGWGAEVVKVEPPRGDPARQIEPLFSMINRDKRSVVLDLRDPSSRAPLEALVKWADVIVEGFRPGVMERLGCGYVQARGWNPRVVYCSISAFGQAGPLREHPAHDINLQALSGVCHVERGTTGPRGAVLPLADLSTSMIAVSAICAGLLARAQHGQGTYLDVAMADGVTSWAQVWGRGVDLKAEAERQMQAQGFVGAIRTQLAAPWLAALDRLKLYALPHYGVFRTADGGYLSLGIVDEGHFWKRLCEALDLGFAAGLRFRGRIAAGLLLRPVVAARLRQRSSAEWMARFREMQIPAYPVRTPRDALLEPVVQARYPFAVDGELGSTLPGARPFTEGAPALGAHTDEMLRALGVL